jgi:PKD repeat protein
VSGPFREASGKQQTLKTGTNSMKRQPNTNPSRSSGSKATVQILAATLALGTMLALPARAGMYVQDPTKPGGIQVSPVIDTVVPTGTNSATVTFHGLQAPYMVQTSPDGTNWQNAGATALQYPDYSGTCLATNVPAGLAQFRLMMLGANKWVGKYQPGMLAVSNVFVGQAKCIGCHTDKINDWYGTAHATALSALTSIGMGSNPSCLPCHTVGFGQPGGFIDVTNTPQLANVQCENCHGSANAHINVSGLQYHPVNTLAAETCGSCHTGANGPTYDEWVTSPHAVMVPDVGYGVSEGTAVYTNDLAVVTTNGSGVVITNVWHGYAVTTSGATNALSGIVNSTDDNAGNGRQMTCGFCHSGPTRIAMLSDWEFRQSGTTNFLTLADKWDAAQFAQTCAVCHDPHFAANEGQLRNPMSSLTYYTLFTGTQPTITNTFVDRFGQTNYSFSYMNGGFASQYDPNMQVCAQCHNSRGARWDGRSKSWNVASNAMVLGASQSFTRGPHLSDQYNVLIGIVQDDYLNGTSNYVAAHSGFTRGSSAYNTNQCVTCHMPSFSVNPSTNYTGHTFALLTNNCTYCHGNVPDYVSYQNSTSNNIATVVALLTSWATNYGPGIFGANYPKYLQNAWEYNIIGSLATITNAGPTGADALRVPDPIKQARFNLYMVQNDGSLGVHNPGYLSFLIADAQNKVNTVINANTNSAYFSASTTTGFAPFTVNFFSGGTGISSHNWNFGDGGTSTLANPSHTYTTPGTNTVSLTAVKAGVTNTFTQVNYITVAIQPAVSFAPSATTVSLAAGGTVTFTNTSTSTGSVTMWRWTMQTTPSTRYVTNYPPATTASYTYTTAGTNNVVLRAYTPAGNITTVATPIIVTP